MLAARSTEVAQRRAASRRGFSNPAPRLNTARARYLVRMQSTAICVPVHATTMHRMDACTLTQRLFPADS